MMDPVSDDQFQTQLKRYACKIFNHRPGKIFTKQNAGMGCAWYIRRSAPYSDLETMFMHSDGWGQYGGDSKHAFDKFIFGYDYVDERCPVEENGGGCIIC